MAGMRIRKKAPKQVERGRIFEIKTLVTHPMDNGFMYTRDGRRIPRRIINRFEARYNGAVIFEADWHEAVAPNPFISFHARAVESGRIEFLWRDDDGSVYADSIEIEVV